MNETLNDRVRRTIAKTFSLPPEIAAGDLRMSSPPAWNSLGHMELVTALESDFGVRFPSYALAQLTSLDDIVRELHKLKVQ